jgi:hypothetical protein
MRGQAAAAAGAGRQVLGLAGFFIVAVGGGLKRREVSANAPSYT